MGTLSGGNGGGWPSDELPDLPPEWGAIVIPDDASELAQEATRVRRELRRQARQQRWRRRLHLPPAQPQPQPQRDGEQALGIPLLVILIAMIATLTSLFVIGWPTQQQGPDPKPTAAATTPGGSPATAPGNPAGNRLDNSAGPGISQPGGATPTSLAPPHAVNGPGTAPPPPPAAPRVDS